MIEELPPAEGETPQASTDEPEPEPQPEPEPESEPEPEPPRARPKAVSKAVPKAEPKRGRPKKETGAPKAKYAPRKRAEPQQPPQPPPEPPQPLDEATVARHVVQHIGQVSRDIFESRRDHWRDLVARNYQ